jgi:Flp pilus assembly protein TadG
MHPVRFWREESGATAVEFGLVFPVLMMMMLGVLMFSMLGGAISGMHFAVEEAARCYAVNRTTCGDSGAAETFAATRYLGPDVDATFAAASASCGYRVTGTATFELRLAVLTFNVPLSTSACYPGKAIA